MKASKGAVFGELDSGECVISDADDQKRAWRLPIGSDDCDQRLGARGRSRTCKPATRSGPDRVDMKVAAIIARSLQADMQAELRDIEPAVTSGTREAGCGLKTELCRHGTSAGLGQRLANNWRDRHHPNQRLDAASLVLN
jgi:hypothetical protein